MLLYADDIAFLYLTLKGMRLVVVINWRKLFQLEVQTCFASIRFNPLCHRDAF